ncbi:MAG: alpha-beta hydrolase superfamily lysophospholipase, partial [Thermoproteota archaeon]
MNDVNSKFRKVYLFEKKLANFTSKSGETLFCRHLIPKNGLAKVKYHFFLVHGAVEHSLRHSPLIEKFKSKYKDEMVLSYYDHYGHGKSSGVRAYVESVNLYSKDFENFVSESLKVTEEKENIQKVVIAHSMGGLIVLNSILNDYEGFSDKFDSLVLSNPCIKPKIDLPAAVSDLVESLPEALEKVRLPLIYNGYGLSNDPERANDFDMDPLVSKFMTVKLGF